MHTIRTIISPHWQYVAVYSFVTLLILWPLLSPGFILTLDMVFTPTLPMPETITSSYIFRAGLHYLSLIMPADSVQKIMLFAILLLSGVGMHRLMCRLQSARVHVHSGVVTAGAYMSGLLYMINPFTYSRFMAGQYSVLLGYACLPFFIYALLQFIHKPSLKPALIVTVWMTSIAIVSIHTLGLIAIIAILMSVTAVWFYRAQPSHLKRLGVYSAGIVVSFVVVSSYWLVPLIQGQGVTATSIATFQTTDQSEFATEGDGVVSQLLHVLRLQGFWGERNDMYMLPQDVFGLWPVFVIIIWGLVIVGAVRAWRHQRPVAIVLITTIVIGAALGAGIGISWLAEYIPLFAGYREPQKFVALIALAYAVCIGFAVPVILARVRSRIVQGSIMAIFAVSVVGLTPVMFRGFSGQLIPTQYPADWYAVNEIFRQDTGTYNVLSLPWHQYMSYNFTGRVIANPTDQFFDASLIVSDDPELGSVTPAVFDSTKHDVTTRILPQAAQSRTLGKTLAALHVKYILLIKDNDYEDYAYLDHQMDIEIVKDSDTVRLYRNTAYQEGNDE